jgi:hypothetical protein
MTRPDYDALQAARKADQNRKIRAEAAQILAMTPAQHLKESAMLLATPVSSENWTNQFLNALLHAQLATAKAATGQPGVGQ